MNQLYLDIYLIIISFQKVCLQSDSDNIICACKDIEYAEFINNDVGHVVTGNMKIFKHPKLIKFAEFGPKFREPVSIDFHKLDSHCCTSVLEFVKNGLILKTLL